MEHVFRDHSSCVNKLKLSDDSRTLVTVSDDATACVYDLPSRTLLTQLQGHSSWLHDVALSRDGNFAVTASADNTALVRGTVGFRVFFQPEVSSYT